MDIIMYLEINKLYIVFNVHAPIINEDNTQIQKKVEEFWSQLKEEMFRTPDKHMEILVEDFNAQIGRENKFRKIGADYSAHKGEVRLAKILHELSKMKITFYNPFLTTRTFPYTKI